MKNIISLTTTIILAFAITSAKAELSSNLTITSNYVDRGASQTENMSAIQGGVDFNSTVGIYVGTWASSLHGDNGYEQDIYIGYANSFKSINYDVSYIYYVYPADITDTNDVNDLSELYASIEVLGITVGAHYSVTEAEKILKQEIYIPL